MDNILFDRIRMLLQDKYFIPSNILYPKDMLYVKALRQYVCEKFLETWSNRCKDPIDVIDDMIITYSNWEMESRNHNNKDLEFMYRTHCDTLQSIKKIIMKELR